VTGYGITLNKSKSKYKIRYFSIFFAHKYFKLPLFSHRLFNVFKNKKRWKNKKER